MRLLTTAVAALVLSLSACGDDPAVTGDTTVMDVDDALADTAVDDTSGPDDTAEPTDTTSPPDTAEVDTSEPADTSESDTAEPADTSSPDDTVAPEDTVEPEDTAGDTAAEDVCCDADADDADVGDDPYAGLDSAALRAALHAETMAGHTPLGYNDARDEMYAVGGIDDVGGRIEAIYTGRTVDANGSRTPKNNCELADGTPTSCRLNTEHTFARYFLDLALTEGSQDYWAAEGDIHHLFPSDEVVNNARWHFDFGNTTCAAEGDCKVDEESLLGQRDGITGYANCPTGNLDLDHVCVMQVRPARQGDVARGLFYMAVRYDMALEDEMEAALRGWHVADPPDARERSRNDAIDAAQGNRNPFVDRPDLVERITDY